MESSAQGAGAAGEQTTRELPPAGAAPGEPPAAGAGDTFERRPELFVGAAFAGGLVLAKLLRRVGR